MSKQTLFKTVIFSLLPCFLLLFGVELLVRIVYFQRHSQYRFGILQVFRSAQRRIMPYKISYKAKREQAEVIADRRFEEDPILGYRTIPGAHTVSFRIGGKTLVTREIVGADGYRTTALNPSDYLGKPELWFFGGSYTWGYSVNNDQTFPWLIQKSVPGWRIRNLAGAGYSNLHAMLQLETAIRNGGRLPEIAVFIFDYSQPARNAGSPSWLSVLHSAPTAGLNSIGPTMPVYRYPRALINPEGNFSIEYVPLVEKSWKGKADFTDSYMTEISKIIFYRILKLCSSHGVKPVFVLQGGSLNDPIVKYASEIGFEVHDISIDFKADNGKYRNFPFDSHPSPLAHLEYYKRILPTILRLTHETPRRSDSPASGISASSDGTLTQLRN